MLGGVGEVVTGGVGGSVVERRGVVTGVLFKTAASAASKFVVWSSIEAVPLMCSMSLDGVGDGRSERGVSCWLSDSGLE